MDKETEYIENIRRKQPSIRIMSTPLYRQYLQEGLDCSGFNLYMAGKWGYECTRLSYNAKLMSKDQDDWNPDNVVRVGHPLPGFYKIVDITGDNCTDSYGQHGFHHSEQFLTCYYSKVDGTDFVTDETVDVFSYPLWQDVAARDTDRLFIGDVFEVKTFDLIDNPYTCYRLQWQLISRSGKRSETYTCATEGYALPEVNTSNKLITELRKVRNNLLDQLDMPVYYVMTNSCLEELASKKPKTFDDLLEINGIGEYKANKFGGVFLYVIKCFEDAKKGKRHIAIALKSTDKKPNNNLELELRKYRKLQSDNEGVPAYCVFPDKVIYAIVENRPSTKSSLLAISGFGTSRYDKYGSDILRIIRCN